MAVRPWISINLIGSGAPDLELLAVNQQSGNQDEVNGTKHNL